jgi:hypothetical protein
LNSNNENLNSKNEELSIYLVDHKNIINNIEEKYKNIKIK